MIRLFVCSKFKSKNKKIFFFQKIPKNVCFSKKLGKFFLKLFSFFKIKQFFVCVFWMGGQLGVHWSLLIYTTHFLGILQPLVSTESSEIKKKGQIEKIFNDFLPNRDYFQQNLKRIKSFPMPEKSMHDNRSQLKGLRCMNILDPFEANRISSETHRRSPPIPSCHACFFVFSIYFYVTNCFHYSFKVTGFFQFRVRFVHLYASKGLFTLTFDKIMEKNFLFGF